MRQKSVSTFSDYYAQLQESDPEIGLEVAAALATAAARESTVPGEGTGGSDRIRLETIVLTRGRPVLDIRSGSAVIDLAEVESQIWKR